MKIALFSCHHDPNYGSMLQAYALSEALRKLGVRSEYIDYSTSPDPTNIRRIVKTLIKAPFMCIDNIINPPKPRGEFAFFRAPAFAKTMEAYERFHQQYIPVSLKRFFFDTIRQKLDVSEYDIYMVGSDQLWSPSLYKPNKPYFLDFADLPIRASYAPSLGTTDLQGDFLKLLKEKLPQFRFLSCREAENAQHLTQLLGREVTHVLDPTLLLTSTDWDKVATIPYIKGNYILAYILGEKDTVIEFAEKLGKKKELPVYFVVTRPKYLDMPNALNGIGPDDWVGLIKNAKYVVTDSFHGTLFCINYNVNFYAFSKRQGNLNVQDNARILEFLGILGLQQRFQDDRINPQLMTDIDFSHVNEKISQLRLKSVAYLQKCITR